ncbi:MAG: DUF3783 domain-containing protein [Desulfobacteraceae bacterium]|nr:MAG: DUF3783 domain-containing protein [Desulfobacteraceae bacterium]
MSLKVVGESKKRMYGPRGLIVCGFSSEERTAVKNLFESTTFNQVPVVFSTDSDRQVQVKDLLARNHHSGADQSCSLECAIIMSGVTEQELHFIMAEYKKTGLPKPLWATLTPTSENWTIEALITELASEHRQIGHH